LEARTLISGFARRRARGSQAWGCRVNEDVRPLPPLPASAGAAFEYLLRNEIGEDGDIAPFCDC
jgi:hypothetical protein